jgi:hypothetical protein
MEWTYGGKEEKKGKRKDKERGLPIGESGWNESMEERRKRKEIGKTRKGDYPSERVFGVDVLRKRGKEREREREGKGVAHRREGME